MIFSDLWDSQMSKENSKQFFGRIKQVVNLRMSYMI